MKRAKTLIYNAPDNTIITAFRREYFNIIRDDYSYYITLPNNRFKIHHHINIFDYRTFSYLIVWDRKTVNCTIFNNQTLNTQTYKIHFDSNDGIFVALVDGYFVKEKIYLLLRLLNHNSIPKSHTTYLIKIPEMKEIKLNGRYASISVPRFLMLDNNSKYYDYLIVDDEGESVWVYKPHARFYHSIIEILGKAIKSLTENGTMYHVVQVDSVFVPRTTDYYNVSFSAYDYRRNMSEDANYKLLEEYFLESKEHNMKCGKSFLTWKPISFNLELS